MKKAEPAIVPQGGGPPAETEAGGDDDETDAPAGLPIVEPTHYAIMGEIARGGQGRVLLARDRRLGREVALKEMLKVSSSSVGRFVREAMITARLQHPGIVPVHEAGRWPTGEPFYAMKRVSGRPLDELVAAAKSHEERLAMLPHAIAAADAIAYAHASAILHRDLKPANILVGEFGETVVVDWGVAKRLDEDDTPLSDLDPLAMQGHTRVGAVVGTPAYMAPEQAAGGPVDRRADVYALGATLYHVLSGVPPYASVSSSDPAPHLAVLDGPPVPLAERAPGVPHELCTIVDKAMARRAEDRYPSAKELADDLKRFAAGQLVAAHRYSTRALVGRWLRRHRAAALLTSLFVVALAAVGTLSVRRVVEERNAARAHQRAAEEANQSLVEANDALRLQTARAELDRDPTAAVAWLKTYPATAPEQRAAGAIAHDAWTRGVARHVFSRDEPLLAVAMSPDERHLAVTGRASLTLYDLATGVGRTFAATEGVGVDAVFSPDGKTLWTSAGHVLLLWNVGTGASRRIDVGREAGVLELTGDGRFLLARDVQHRTVTLRDVVGDREVPLPAEAVTGAFLPDGKTVAIATGTALFFQPLGGGPPVRAATLASASSPKDVRVSGDGRLLAVSSDVGIDVYDARGALVRHLRAPNFQPSMRGLLLDKSDRVMSCSRLGQVWVWSVASGESHVLGEASSPCSEMRLAPDGVSLVMPGVANQVQVWDLVGGGLRRLFGHSATVNRIAMSSSGGWVASVSGDQTARVWRLGEGDLRVLHGVTSHSRLAADRYVLTAEKSSHALERIDLRTGDTKTVSGPRPLSWGTATWLSPDGEVAVYADDTEQIWRWDAASNTARRWFRYVRPGARHVAHDLSPDGRFFVGASTDFSVVLVDLQTMAQRELGRHDAIPEAVKFSPDGKLVASAARDRLVRVWDLEKGTSRAFAGHTAFLWDVSFSSDRRHVASAGADSTIRVWDLASGESQVLRGHTSTVVSIDYHPDGKRLVSVSDDGTARIWDVATGDNEIVRREHAVLYYAAYSADGRYVSSTATDSATAVWDPAVTPVFERDPAALRRWFDRISSATVGADGRVSTPSLP